MGGRPCSKPGLKRLLHPLDERHETRNRLQRLRVVFAAQGVAVLVAQRTPARRPDLGLQSVPRPTWEAEAVRHVIGGLVVARHRHRGRPCKVVVQNLW